MSVIITDLEERVIRIKDELEFSINPVTEENRPKLPRRNETTKTHPGEALLDRNYIKQIWRLSPPSYKPKVTRVP